MKQGQYIMDFIPKKLNPSLLWQHFDEIRKIPHCSSNEKPLGAYVCTVADKKHFKTKCDRSGNIVIHKPGTSGYEQSPIVVLQGHLDMVCEKSSHADHNFKKNPLNVMIDGDWLKADGTTLGADNGIGIASMLAVLEDDSLVHGPIECLFTVEEETGLIGASKLDSDFIRGRILLNLDSEEEGSFYIGCAGGGDSEIKLPIQRLKTNEKIAIKIQLDGFRSGHSGIDIDAGRGNAIQLLARMLLDIPLPFGLIDLEGGSKHNVIPGKASASILVDKTDIEELEKNVKKCFQEIRFEYKAIEKEIKLDIQTLKSITKSPMDEDSKNRYLSLLAGLPHGVMTMSQEIPGLVETSNNLAIVKCSKNECVIHTSTRSSILSALEAVRKKIEAIALLASAKTTHLDGYPAWTPNLESPLLKTMKIVYKSLFPKEPEVKAIHAGLECGIIGEKFPGMDMISFGPNIKNPHSIDERVHIGSVERFWNLLTAALKALVKSK
jgi:dipeptidase D